MGAFLVGEIMAVGGWAVGCLAWLGWVVYRWPVAGASLLTAGVSGLYLDELELQAAEQYRRWRRQRAVGWVVVTFLAVGAVGAVVLATVCGQ